MLAERLWLHICLLLQIELGDIVYLALADGAKLQYGFRLLGPDRAASAKDKDKVLAAFCAH